MSEIEIEGVCPVCSLLLRQNGTCRCGYQDRSFDSRALLAVGWIVLILVMVAVGFGGLALGWLGLTAVCFGLGIVLVVPWGIWVAFGLLGAETKGQGPHWSAAVPGGES